MDAARERKRKKWDVAVVGGVPIAKSEPGKPGQVDKLMIARAQKGASAVLQKINQVCSPANYFSTELDQLLIPFRTVCRT